MKLLEEQARRIAEEAKSDQPKPKSMTFVKYVIGDVYILSYPL